MLTREEIMAVYQAGPEAVIMLIESMERRHAQEVADLTARVEALNEQVAKLTARVNEQEARLKQTSANSHKPPSSDGLGSGRKRRTKSERKRSGKKAGGQAGHEGHTLKLAEQADEVQVHAPETCSGCGQALHEQDTVQVERRQVLELPPIRLQVVEHRVERRECQSCHTQTAGVFPQGVTQVVQYGPNVRALALYLQVYHFLPYARTQAFFQDVLSCTISTGTLASWQAQCYERLADVEQAIKRTLCQEAVVHFDESGLRVEKTLAWLHSASTAQLTYYAVHTKRGQEAFDAIGILPVFRGTAVHDAWKSYWTYLCRHSLCSAHLLRELTAIHENTQQAWAKQLHNWLISVKIAVEAAQADGRRQFSAPELGHFERAYDQMLECGFALNPAAPENGRRGRTPQSFEYNLLVRLRDHRSAVLAFMYDFGVPFDNNQAERDVRMVKLRQKISGCFRQSDFAAYFCRIRGYLSTLHKQGTSILVALHSVFAGRTLWPQGLT